MCQISFGSLLKSFKRLSLPTEDIGTNGEGLCNLANLLKGNGVRKSER